MCYALYSSVYKVSIEIMTRVYPFSNPVRSSPQNRLATIVSYIRLNLQKSSCIQMFLKK